MLKDNGLMAIELAPPFIIVKHSVDGTMKPFHTFEVWEVPHDPQALIDKAGVASSLTQSFSNARYDIARFECLKWLDRNRDRQTTTLWIEQRHELFAVGEAIR